MHIRLSNLYCVILAIYCIFCMFSCSSVVMYVNFIFFGKLYTYLIYFTFPHGGISPVL